MRHTLKAMLVAMILVMPLAARAEPPMADTVENHLAQAKSYKQKANEYRAQAAEHRAMAAEYKKLVPGAAKGGGENPWAKKMEAHCYTIVADTEKLAADADRAAEYHTLRAQDLKRNP